MNTCIVSIDFLYNHANFIFAKKISICGFTPNRKIISQVINYPYPSKNVDINGNNENRNYNIDGNLVDVKRNGNLTYHRIDLELAKILKSCNVVIVNNANEKEFISHYTASNTCRLINIHSEENNMVTQRTDEQEKF